MDRFIDCAKQHPELNFPVTPVGCGIAGYEQVMVAPWFAEAKDLQNVYSKIVDSFPEVK